LKRISGVFAVTLAVVCVGLAAVAVAHTARYDSTVTIHYKKNGPDPDTFFGKVDSTNPRCVANRTVNLNRRDGTTSVLVATDTADTAGDWDVTLPGAATPGDYYAVARRKVLRHNSKHFHLCRRAVSRDLTVH
jgi:hypothetical protein